MEYCMLYTQLTQILKLNVLFGIVEFTLYLFFICGELDDALLLTSLQRLAALAMLLVSMTSVMYSL
jgi:hypothetical protein